MKNIKKMDELEMSINLKAIKWSWGITALALFVWIVVDIFKKGITEAVATPQSIIFYIQIIAYLLISIILNRKIRDEK